MPNVRQNRSQLWANATRLLQNQQFFQSYRSMKLMIENFKYSQNENTQKTIDGFLKEADQKFAQKINEIGEETQGLDASLREARKNRKKLEAERKRTLHLYVNLAKFIQEDGNIIDMNSLKQIRAQQWSTAINLMQQEQYDDAVRVMRLFIQNFIYQKPQGDRQNIKQQYEKIDREFWMKIRETKEDAEEVEPSDPSKANVIRRYRLAEAMHNRAERLFKFLANYVQEDGSVVPLG